MDIKTPPLDPIDAPSDSDQNQGSPQKRRRGGGPKTDFGRKVVAGNATKWALYSSDPTAGGESAEDFDSMQAGLFDHFQPVGTYEAWLVGRIAREFLALDRNDRAIRALIDLRAARVDPPVPPNFVKRALNNVSWSTFDRPLDTTTFLMLLDKYPETRMVEPEVIGDIWRAAEVLQWTIPDDVATSSSGMTVGDLRSLFTSIAEANGLEPNSVKNALEDINEVALQLALGAQERVERMLKEDDQRAKRAARAHLPSFDDLEKLMKHKRSVERSLTQNLDALETTQRARSGALEPRIRLHVTGDDDAHLHGGGSGQDE